MGAGSAYGALMGLAVGDALGTTHEFRSDLCPPRFPELAIGPLTDITGGGPFGMKPGQVTDDTAMACLLAEALTGRTGPREGPVIDDGAAAHLYVKWLSTEPPDVGNQTRNTLELVRRGVAPAEAGRRVWLESERRVAGNGSLMRTAPIGVYYAGRFPALWDASFQDSAVTHFDPRCQLACAVLNTAISDAVMRKKPITLEKLKDQALKALLRAGKHLLAKDPDEANAIKSAIKALREDLTLA